MSKRIQENAKKRAVAARERERNTRERERQSKARGNQREARLHRNSAELHADAAADAETFLELDQEIEGDQLDTPATAGGASP
jgi:hypothetical protein